MGPGTPAQVPNHDVTNLLVEWSRGDKAAFDRLLPLVYGQLRSIAARHFRRERPGHALQPTALVHEAYLKLIDQRRADWKNRAQFFGVAAQVMRRILIDHARAQRTAKRGAGETVSLDTAKEIARAPIPDVLALDAALARLAARPTKRPPSPLRIGYWSRISRLSKRHSMPGSARRRRTSRPPPRQKPRGSRSVRPRPKR